MLTRLLASGTIDPDSLEALLDKSRTELSRSGLEPCLYSHLSTSFLLGKLGLKSTLEMPEEARALIATREAELVAARRSDHVNPTITAANEAITRTSEAVSTEIERCELLATRLRTRGVEPHRYAPCRTCA